MSGIYDGSLNRANYGHRFIIICVCASVCVCVWRSAGQPILVGKHCHGLACSIACPQGTMKLLKMANIPRNEYPRQRTRQQADTKHHTHTIWRVHERNLSSVYFGHSSHQCLVSQRTILSISSPIACVVVVVRTMHSEIYHVKQIQHVNEIRNSIFFLRQRRRGPSARPQVSHTYNISSL